MESVAISTSFFMNGTVENNTSCSITFMQNEVSVYDFQKPIRGSYNWLMSLAL